MQDSQNQNVSEARPQNATGLQSQTATVPITEANSGVQGQGGSSLLFGNTPGNTGSLLNQTQVVGTTQTTPKQEQTIANPQSSKGALIFDVFLAAAVILALAWVFRQMAKITERNN